MREPSLILAITGIALLCFAAGLYYGATESTRDISHWREVTDSALLAGLSGIRASQLSMLSCETAFAAVAVLGLALFAKTKCEVDGRVGWSRLAGAAGAAIVFLIGSAWFHVHWALQQME